MPTLLAIFPKPNDLLSLEPEDLAAILIEIIPGVSQSAGFMLEALTAPLYPPQGGGYPVGSAQNVMMALGEALSWLVTQGIVMRNPTQPAAWYVLTRRGSRLKTRDDVEAFLKGRALPLDLLQPRLVEKVRHLFLRGDHDTAVFQAFKEVEVSVRALGDYPDDLVGVALMREAFHPDRGKLTDKTDVTAEREALAALFAGAMGYCKNPGSHRDVKLDRQNAARLIIFASYLLDILLDRLMA
jgi:uncharacterized protein (TIGR02391 family)